MGKTPHLPDPGLTSEVNFKYYLYGNFMLGLRDEVNPKTSLIVNASLIFHCYDYFQLVSHQEAASSIPIPPDLNYLIPLKIFGTSREVLKDFGIISVIYK